jgi:hypothetical protein
MSDTTGRRILNQRELTKTETFDAEHRSTADMRYYLLDKNHPNATDETRFAHINLGSSTNMWHTVYAKQLGT